MPKLVINPNQPYNFTCSFHTKQTASLEDPPRNKPDPTTFSSPNFEITMKRALSIRHFEHCLDAQLIQKP